MKVKLLVAFVVVVASLLGCQPARHDGATSSVAFVPSTPKPTVASAPAPSSPAAAPEPGTYLGRRIAPTMSHEAAAWLVRPEREAEESSKRMLEELRLRPGDVACDLGAGNGFHTLAMARSVAPRGRAIAVDIQPEMLALLEKRAAAEKIANVETVLGAASDPRLPAGTCDLVLMADVYHELDDPAAMLGNVKRALSPRGVVVLLEFRAEDPKVPIKPEHKMSRAQISLELEANGYELERSYDDLPWQHLMFFAPRGRERAR